MNQQNYLNKHEKQLVFYLTPKLLLLFIVKSQLIGSSGTCHYNSKLHLKDCDSLSHREKTVYSDNGETFIPA